MDMRKSKLMLERKNGPGIDKKQLSLLLYFGTGLVVQNFCTRETINGIKTLSHDPMKRTWA